MCNWKIPVCGLQPRRAQQAGEHTLASSWASASFTLIRELPGHQQLVPNKGRTSLSPQSQPLQNWVDNTRFLGHHFSIWCFDLAKQTLTLFSARQHVSPQEGCCSTHKMITVFNAALKVRKLSKDTMAGGLCRTHRDSVQLPLVQHPCRRHPPRPPLPTNPRGCNFWRNHECVTELDWSPYSL